MESQQVNEIKKALSEAEPSKRSRLSAVAMDILRARERGVPYRALAILLKTTLGSGASRSNIQQWVVRQQRKRKINDNTVTPFLDLPQSTESIGSMQERKSGKY